MSRLQIIIYQDIVNDVSLNCRSVFPFCRENSYAIFFPMEKYDKLKVQKVLKLIRRVLINKRDIF